MKIIHKIASWLYAQFKDIARIQQKRYAEIAYWEQKELENIFALLLLGSCTGIPIAPVYITLELLPYLEEELDSLLEKIDTAHDPFGELFSLLGIG